jgi:hypothetical protein
LEAFVELNNSGAEPDTPKAVIRIKAYLRAVKWDIQQNSEVKQALYLALRLSLCASLT